MAGQIKTQAKVFFHIKPDLEFFLYRLFCAIFAVFPKIPIQSVESRKGQFLAISTRKLILKPYPIQIITNGNDRSRILIVGQERLSFGTPLPFVLFLLKNTEGVGFVLAHDRESNVGGIFAAGLVDGIKGKSIRPHRYNPPTAARQKRL